MWAAILLLSAILFIATITTLSYKLGLTRTDNARRTAIIGFFLSFLPPFALLYLVVLMMRDDAGTV